MSTDSPSFKLSRGAVPWVLGFLSVTIVAAAGSAFPPDAWFEALIKPTWQPPDWVFAPVWSTLYLLMGCSLALLLRSARSTQRTTAIAWFVGQLILNAAWTPVFFGLHAPGYALAIISVLWLLLVASMTSAMKVSTTAGWLLAPTFLWVSFALVLNAVIVALN